MSWSRARRSSVRIDPRRLFVFDATGALAAAPVWRDRHGGCCHGAHHARRHRPCLRAAGASGYALKPLDHVWEQGRAYALLGPSGCGKTTLLNIISGLVMPSEGRLLFDDAT